jgi:hypothetical protein
VRVAGSGGFLLIDFGGGGVHLDAVEKYTAKLCDEAMKRLPLLLTALLAGFYLLPQQVQAQNVSKIKQNARTAAAGISVSTANGKTTVVYNHKEVWTGKATGKVSGRAKVVDGIEYAAAFDGAKVIWESKPGAAKKVQ